MRMASLHKQPGRPHWFCAFTGPDGKRRFKSTGTGDKRQAKEICNTWARSSELGKAGITPESIATTATITMEKTDAGFTVTQSHLEVTARVPGQDKNKVLEIANAAKAGCPISRLLKANITMDARLET